MSNSHLVTHGIKEMFDHLPPITTKKNPIIAGILGFCLGGIGLGIYFGTWQDFLFPILIFIGLSIIFPVLGTGAAMFFVTLWGVLRALNSGTQFS